MTPNTAAFPHNGQGAFDPAVSRPAQARRSRTHGRQRTASGFLWILPALVVSVGLIYFCIGYTGWISTLNWDGISPDPQSVGFANYTRLFSDPVFWKTLGHTVSFFLITTAAQVVLGLVFAALLHSNVRLAAVYKVVIFIPVVIAPATMAPVFRQLFSVNGQLNGVLQGIGLGFLAQPWLAQTSTALGAIILIQIWQSTGVAFILYFASMSQIEPETLEAARLDGAGNLRILTAMVWPSVRGTTIALATLSAIASLKTFDVPYLVTSGGPNYATEFLGTYIYRTSVANSEVGYGSALSVMLLVLALGVAIALNVRGRGRAASDV